MRNACDSDSRCGLACDVSTRDANSLAMWAERCEPLRDGPKMADRVQNTDFRAENCRFWQSDPFDLLETQAFGGRRIFAGKPTIFAENRGKPQVGVRHLRSVPFCSAPSLKLSLPTQGGRASLARPGEDVREHEANGAQYAHPGIPHASL